MWKRNGRLEKEVTPMTKNGSGSAQRSNRSHLTVQTNRPVQGIFSVFKGLPGLWVMTSSSPLDCVNISQHLSKRTFSIKMGYCCTIVETLPTWPPFSASSVVNNTKAKNFRVLDPVGLLILFLF